MRRLIVPLLGAALLPACASRTPPVGVAPPIAESPVVALPPPGARAGMAIPPRLADGSYATPNRALSPAATLWHLRAALNVAALACRGPDQAPIVANYNALLTRAKPLLADAERRYAAQYRDSGVVDWRDRYDDTQTRLYNFFAQAEARDGFCRAAAATLAHPDPLADPTLALVERPFTDFYRAYDAWRQPTAAIIAVAAAAPQASVPPRLTVALDGLNDTVVTVGTPR